MEGSLSMLRPSLASRLPAVMRRIKIEGLIQVCRQPLDSLLSPTPPPSVPPSPPPSPLFHRPWALGTSGARGSWTR